MPTYRAIGPTHVAANVTTVDCHKQVRTWRLLRAVMKLLIPTCNCTFNNEQPHNKTSTTSPPLPPSSSRPSSSSSSSRSSSSSSSLSSSFSFSSSSSSSSSSSPSSFLTGTIFGYKKGKVKFCIQSNSTSLNPTLLLELAVPTTILAREMRGGLLRIALECSTSTSTNTSDITSNPSLLEMPVWRMYCNGRRVGFAVKRKPSKTDMEVLSKMKNIVVGAGIVSGKEIGCNDDDIMYLRGNFERIRRSSDAESFHLIDPNGNINQDLSIFFLRSQDQRY